MSLKPKLPSSKIKKKKKEKKNPQHLLSVVAHFNPNTPKMGASGSLSVPGQQDSLVYILRSRSARVK